MLHRCCIGLTMIALLLGTRVYGQDADRQALIQSVEQSLKAGTLISDIETIVAGQSEPATAGPAQVIVALNQLTARMYQNGAYRTGEAVAIQTLAYAEKKLGPEHPDTLTSVNNLAFLYQRQGRYGEAEPLYKRALQAREQVLGPEHPDTLTSVNNLAFLYESQGRYGEAEPLYKRALQASEQVFGTAHPQTLSTQLNYITLLVNMQHVPDALRSLKRLEPHLFTFAVLQLQTTIQHHVKRHFLLTQSIFQDVVFTLATQQPSASLATYAADVLLRWKRLQGDEDAYIAQLIRTTDNPDLTALGQRIMALRSTLSRLLNTPDPDPALVSQALHALETQEAGLAQRSRHYKQHLNSRGIRADDIRAYLPTRSALLELRQYHPVDFRTGSSGEPHFLALLLPAEPVADQELWLVDLGPVATHLPLWQILRQHFDTQVARTLYQAVFGQLDAHLAQFDTLYIAPDGFLHVMALASLVLPEGQYWFQRQVLRQLQTGRDLLPRPTLTEAKGLITLGGIDYDAYGPQTGPVAAATVAHPEHRAAHRYLAQHILKFSPLPNSGPETAEIAQYYWDYYSSKPQVWQGPEASETRLKSLLNPPRVLHLATHGFYLPRQGITEEQPMALSGLALAGANQGLAGHVSPAEDDGILYALEVQSLNLEGTQLVALSACDTGQGMVDYSDGVYGLVRAFRTAGARNVLMTLWPVGDASARAFMLEFYRHWFSGGMTDAALALDATRRTFVDHPNVAWRDPQVWAPFVLIESR